MTSTTIQLTDSIPRRDADGAPPPSAPASPYLFGPVIDFLCLGGGSIVGLILVALLLPVTAEPELLIAMLLVANFINNPHFAHSYQIFYRNYRAKAFGDAVPTLRLRYIVAGIVVPLSLSLFFFYAVGTGDKRLLGLGGNLMAFFVGWHYVKQGYGMAIVDSVLKRRFYANLEKKTLLVNAYICWIAGWLATNRAWADRKLWGIDYLRISVPDPLFVAVAGVAVASSLLVVATFARRILSSGSGSIAWNGAIAYVVSIYLWLILVRFNPLFIVVIPAFHSLQYLLVVWRFQLNVEHDREDHSAPTGGLLGRYLHTRGTLRFTLFLGAGALLGLIGFWLAPLAFDTVVPYDRSVFGTTLFLFIFWIFINVHHYFLDNVMWRRDNPDTRRFLFS